MMMSVDEMILSAKCQIQIQPQPTNLGLRHGLHMAHQNFNSLHDEWRSGFAYTFCQQLGSRSQESFFLLADVFRGDELRHRSHFEKQQYRVFFFFQFNMAQSASSANAKDATSSTATAENSWLAALSKAARKGSSSKEASLIVCGMLATNHSLSLSAVHRLFSKHIAIIFAFIQCDSLISD
jgi:hypothetical protein